MKKTPYSLEYFRNFILFNLCFLGVQLFILCSQSGSLVSSIKLPWSIYLQIIGTVLIQLCFYLILSLIQSWLMHGIIKRNGGYFTLDQWQLIIWSLSAGAILYANIYFFPLSVFSKLFSPPIPLPFILLLLGCSLAGLSLLILNALLYRNALSVLSLASIFAIGYAMLLPVHQTANSTTEQPNVILLSIDSLSPARVTPQNMPFLSHLLEQNIHFTNTISPLARTYPAWCSILTGLYPKHHHADENLIAKNKVNSKASIAWKLKQRGYETIYATDDKRFSNIDKHFGFNKLIGPKAGVNDVILGSFNDFPLGNLLVNYRISAWLFPYNYSNRASFFSFYPTTFDRELQKQLSDQTAKKPIFLAVHFTLPHWPYAWAESLPNQLNNEFSLSKRDLLYQQTLRRVDRQYQSFFNYLQEHNYLTNSLVIILSDHGEALYNPGSRLTNYQNYQSHLTSRLAEYFKTKTATDLDKSVGHGSDILSPKQYQSVLAFAIYKEGQLVTGKRKIDTRVALIDLAPTIFSYLKMKTSIKMDGISLLQSIIDPDAVLPNRSFFIESGMYPNQDFSKEKAIALGHKLFNVNNETGELELKANELIAINNHKLYGIIGGNWVFALYPDEQSYIPVIQNLVTGEWIDDLQSDFAQKTPAKRLKQQLQHYYRNKLVLPIS